MTTSIGSIYTKLEHNFQPSQVTTSGNRHAKLALLSETAKSRSQSTGRSSPSPPSSKWFAQGAGTEKIGFLGTARETHAWIQTKAQTSGSGRCSRSASAIAPAGHRVDPRVRPRVGGVESKRPPRRPPPDRRGGGRLRGWMGGCRLAAWSRGGQECFFSSCE